jgi:Tfp pilus assembly protein PilX
MALSHFSKVFAIKELKIAKLLTDPTAAPPATYGTSSALVGSKKLTINGTVNSKYLRGDNRLLDADAVLDSVTAVVDYAKLSLDAMSIMFSTLVVDSGTTPNQLATWQLANTDSMNYFKIEGRAVGADPTAGDVLFSLWKCKISSFPTIGLNEEDYQVSALNLIVVPRLADNFWLQSVIRETAVALT